MKKLISALILCLLLFLACGTMAEQSVDSIEITLDTISGATPVSGQQKFVWDLTDARGNQVPDGIYTVKIEGCLYWEDSILYSAEIDLRKVMSGTVEVQMTPGTERHENEKMLQDVEVKIMSTSKGNDNTANWLGGLSPEDVLEYMKAHYDEGLIIVEVNTDYACASVPCLSPLLPPYLIS